MMKTMALLVGCLFFASSANAVTTGFQSGDILGNLLYSDNSEATGSVIVNEHFSEGTGSLVFDVTNNSNTYVAGFAISTNNGSSQGLFVSETYVNLGWGSIYRSSEAWDTGIFAALSLPFADLFGDDDGVYLFGYYNQGLEDEILGEDDGNGHIITKEDVFLQSVALAILDPENNSLIGPEGGFTIDEFGVFEGLPASDILVLGANDDGNGGVNFTAFGSGPQDVPEPGTLMLFGLGLAGIAAAKRRKAK